jgi:Putative MetA-pathway of phenol degradation
MTLDYGVKAVSRVRFPARRSIRYAVVTVVSACMLCHVQTAAAFDVDADDYAAGAFPAGTNVGLLYYQYGDYNALFSDGERVSPGDLTTNIGILRAVHFVKIGPFTADPQFLLPFGAEQGSKNLSTLGSTGGAGDLILANTVWFYNDPKTNHYFGITPIIYVPTGTYSNRRPLNLGANRWEFVLQTGYYTPIITKNFFLEMAADSSFFTNNGNYGPASQTLSEAPLVELQGWTRYFLTENFDIRAGVLYYVGGNESIDGVSQRNPERTVTFKAGFDWSVAPSWNVLADYVKDASNRNGVSEGNGVNFRLLKVF